MHLEFSHILFNMYEVIFHSRMPIRHKPKRSLACPPVAIKISYDENLRISQLANLQISKDLVNSTPLFL